MCQPCLKVKGHVSLDLWCLPVFMVSMSQAYLVSMTNFSSPVCVDALSPSQQLFSHVVTFPCLPWVCLRSVIVTFHGHTSDTLVNVNAPVVAM